MILAAGLATRLRPLTFALPKVLVPLGPVTILDFWVAALCARGVEAVVLNAFHRKEELARAVSAKHWPIPVEVRPEPFLLGTGGAIRKVLDFFDGKPFAVVNGDIVCNARIDELCARHAESGASVSLLMHDWPEFNNVAVDRQDRILGFGAEAEVLAARDDGIRLLAFTGIHCINPEAIEPAPEGVFTDILDIYRGLIRAGSPPRALFQQDLFWREAGSVDSYRALLAELSTLPAGFLPPLVTGAGAGG
jgi:mannose-1-phosphate guanylyltransferase